MNKSSTIDSALILDQKHQPHNSTPKDGVSTLGGWNGRHWLGWIDFDLKDFNSTEKMDTAIADWVNKYPILKESPHFTTPRGGHRFLIAWNSEPKNFGANSGFSLIPESTRWEKYLDEFEFRNNEAVPLEIALATGEDYALGQTVPGGQKIFIVETDESTQSTKTKLLIEAKSLSSAANKNLRE